MLSQRPVDPDTDKDFILELACMGSYESVPDWHRSTSFRAYRESWFKSDFPNQVMDGLKQSLADPRTLLQVWEEDGQRAGLLWLDFAQTPQGVTVAMVRDLVVEPGHQRRGIGRLMLQAAEQGARDNSAGVMRVETSVANEATQRIYQRAGFTVARLIYEKVMDG